MAAAKSGLSFLIRGGPGTGKSHIARRVVEAVAPQKMCYVVSFTNAAVANLAGLPARTMTLDRFVTRVLHRDALVTPCLILWDEVFFASTNMLARFSKIQVYGDVQIVACGDPHQLQCPDNHWKGTPCPCALRDSQMLASLCPTHCNLRTCRRFDQTLQGFCHSILRRDGDIPALVSQGKQLWPSTSAHT